MKQFEILRSLVPRQWGKYLAGGVDRSADFELVF
jgi:hypothetical protein